MNPFKPLIGKTVQSVTIAQRDLYEANPTDNVYEVAQFTCTDGSVVEVAAMDGVGADRFFSVFEPAPKEATS